MQLRRFFIFIALSLAFAAQARQSVGLVLSGGGSKGIAHIGVIQALEDNDIPIDYVTGTSMGAIVGGLYAAGYTPDEMMELLLSRGFGYWSTGRIDPNLTYYFNREAPSPALFTLPLAAGGNKKSAAVPESLISPLPMNFAFMELFSGYTAACGGDFDRLFVPFRCVASDVGSHCKRVLSSGSLGDAIRASMSFPIVFQPTDVDGTLLYDGGIYDNFPVDVMRQTFAPSIMVGVDVSTPSKGPQTSMMEQLENLVIQNNDYSLPASEGIKLHIDLHEFGLLDFPKARQIYRIGYEHAMSMMDSIKARVTSRTPAEVRRLRRAVFKSRIPYERFDKVTVTGGTDRQNDYIRYLFRPVQGCDTIGIDRARDAYYRAISSGKLRDLSIHSAYDDTTGLFALNLKAAVKGRFKLGAGGYITSGSGSYLYVSAGYSSLSFRSLNVGVSGWIGQSVMAGMVGGRVYLHTPLASAIDLQAVVSRRKFYETEHLFYEDKTPTFIIDHEYFGRLGWSVAAGRTGSLSVGAGYGELRGSFFRNNRLASYEDGRDHSNYSLGQVYLRYTSSTLDAENLPTSGHAYHVCAMGVAGRDKETGDVTHVSHPEWVQAEIRTRNFWPLGRHFSLGLESDVLLSTRKLSATYSSSLAAAPSYTPTPSSAAAFNPAFRANSFIAGGLVPVYRYNDNLSWRLGAYAFVPLRKIMEGEAADSPVYGGWLRHAEVYAETAVAYRFPFASLSGYVNYSSAPGDKWHVGIAFGVFIEPPKFLR